MAKETHGGELWRANLSSALFGLGNLSVAALYFGQAFNDAFNPRTALLGVALFALTYIYALIISIGGEK